MTLNATCLVCMSVLVVACSRDTGSTGGDHPVESNTAGPSFVPALKFRPAAAPPNAAGYVHVPGDAMVHASCLAAVPSGSLVHLDGSVSLGGATIMAASSCSYPSCTMGQDKTQCGGNEGATPTSGGGWMAFNAMTPPSVCRLGRRECSPCA
jgi:hypothetical protein